MGDLSRRAMLAMSAVLPLTAKPNASAQTDDGPPHVESNTLIAYFTRSGNTKVIAGTLQRALGADLFEIRPARAYPEDYEETVAQATRERESGYEPPLESEVPGIAAYDTIFLGSPTWGGTAPPVIRSFLNTHDLNGKIIRPFITHGGYGVGDVLSIIAEHATGAQVATPFVMEADQERRTLSQVRGWLDEIQPS